MKNRLVFIFALTLPTIALAESGVDRILFAAAQGAVVGGFLGLIGGLIWGMSALVKKARPKIGKLMASSASKVDRFGSKSKKAIGDFKASDEDRILGIEDIYYEAASDELLQSNQVKGLWAKSQVLADGDDKKQEAIYVRLRAKQLSEAEVAEDAKQESASNGEADRWTDALTLLEKVREGLIDPSEIPETMKALDAAERKRLRQNKIYSGLFQFLLFCIFAVILYGIFKYT